MDAVARVAAYFPAQSITSFWIISNLIINNSQTCDEQTRSLIIAIIVIFAVATMVSAFTDTYTATNNQKFTVLLVPLYGPVCMSLPTDVDKDRVYEHFYLKVRDYVRAVIACTTFVLIVVFINPIVACLFPSDEPDSLSSLSSSVVRTIPIVVAVITSLMMICLGPPRQSLGYQNVDETCPPLERKMGDNPIYNKQGSMYPGQIRMSGSQAGGYGQGEDDDGGGYDGPPQMHASKQMSMSPYSSHSAAPSYQHHSNSMMHASSQRAPYRGDSMASSRHMGPSQGDV